MSAKKPRISNVWFARQSEFVTALVSYDNGDVAVGVSKCAKDLDEFELKKGKQLAVKRAQKIAILSDVFPNMY